MKKCFYCDFFVNYNRKNKEAVCSKKGCNVHRNQNGCELAVYSNKDKGHVDRSLKEGLVLTSTCLALGKKGDGVFKVGNGFVIIAKNTEPNQKYELKIRKVLRTVAFEDVIQKLS